MNIARHVARLAKTAIAVTFQGGYAVKSDRSIARFPGASILKERRNDKHRVTYGLYQFPDLSKLEMKRIGNMFTHFTAKT